MKLSNLTFGNTTLTQKKIPFHLWYDRVICVKRWSLSLWLQISWCKSTPGYPHLPYWLNYNNAPYAIKYQHEILRYNHLTNYIRAGGHQPHDFVLIDGLIFSYPWILTKRTRPGSLQLQPRWTGRGLFTPSMNRPRIPQERAFERGQQKLYTDGH